MRMYDLILKKRNGGTLTNGEIEEMVAQYTAGNIPDYQMSAMLMAIYFRGMDDGETAALTMAMARSGDQVDLSSIPGVKVDKHSTGGVGDKTTLIVGPIVASCGVPVAKMSGRGLGHTGGTVDKLESIPGFQTTLDPEEFLQTVRQTGIAVIGQSGNLAPADKKLYALRDVTATVDSIPLIAASIMSKKIAAGADCILLDVKTGSGAFMKTVEDAIALAQCMVRIGEQVGRKTVALITDMDRPLGYQIGNSLEVEEAVETLMGKGPADLSKVCLHLAGNMLCLAGLGNGDIWKCISLAREAILTGRALEKFQEMAAAQGGDASLLAEPGLFPQAAKMRVVRSKQSGYLTHINAQACGMASVALGAGRVTKDSPIDHSAGIRFHCTVGDEIEEGDPICSLLGETQAQLDEAEAILKQAVTIGSEEPELPPLIHARVTIDGVERFKAPTERPLY